MLRMTQKMPAKVKRSFRLSNLSSKNLNLLSTVGILKLAQEI